MSEYILNNDIPIEMARKYLVILGDCHRIKKSKSLLLVVSSIFFFLAFSCSDVRSKRKWIEVRSFFCDSLNQDKYYSKLSFESVVSICGDDTAYAKGRIRDFFNSLTSGSDQSFLMKDSLLFVSFDVNNKTVAGPTVEIILRQNDWFVRNIRMGK